MADIFQGIDGKGLTRKQWEEKRMSSDWTLKEYRNEKLWVRLAWIGKYDKALPSEYRHSHGIQVYNRLLIKASEWDEAIVDKGWIIDTAASETFRTKSAAESAYEDMLLRYTDSSMDEDEDGDIIFVEVGNSLAPIVAGNRLMNDEAQIAAAEEKGVSVGGWS